MSKPNREIACIGIQTRIIMLAWTLTEINLTKWAKIMVRFLAMQKITWFSHRLHLFLNKILIESKLALRFKKTIQTSIIMLAWTLTETSLTKWAKIMVRFSAMQKFMWFSHCLHLFPNKISIVRELTLRFRKIDRYDSAFMTHYPNDHVGINAN